MKAYLDRLRAWWTALAPREQRLVGVGGVVAGVIIFYLGIWEPVVAASVAREASLTQARRIGERLEEIAVEVEKARRTASGTGSGRTLSLLAAVDQSSKLAQLGKAPSRIQPEGDKQVRIWLEDVPFDAVVRWMVDLQMRYGVSVDNADIERESGSGLVNVRLLLVRP